MYFSKTKNIRCQWTISGIYFYLFWWCCTTHRAGVCCLLQCPGAAPCSCWVRTPHPAYLCPGTAGHKTHRNCNCTACTVIEFQNSAKRYGNKQKKNVTTTCILYCTQSNVTAAASYYLKWEDFYFLNEKGLSSCHSQRQSHSSQHYPPPYPYTPLHCCILALGSPRSPERRPPEPHSSD